MQTAPFVEIVQKDGPFDGRKIRTRDAARLGYKEISRTDAWEDDDGLGKYILRCELLPIPARRVSATAIHPYS
jgi:hypothetical protein